MAWNEIRRIDDEASNVAKFVFTNDTAVAESVLYRYPTYEERTVICISTQSGCPVGCRFCGAGDAFVRNLTSDEIVSQAVYSVQQTGFHAIRLKKLQIMFMSMGEPLLNLKNLIPALRELHSLYPHAALLISTTGPDIDYRPLQDISREIPTIGLQFSIHESTDEARDKLIPFKKKLDLDNIAYQGEQWHNFTGRKPFFNYCAHAGNSSEDDAFNLWLMFKPHHWEATVSVICERNEGLPATNDYQRKLATDFAEKLLVKGYNVRVFDPAGQDTIGGGCGQLWFVQKWMEDHPELAKPSIGRGKPVVHAPTVETV